MISFKNRSIAGTAAAIATMITIAAASPLRAETVSIPVAYGDLDLSRPAGVAAVRTRIHRAVDRICGQPTGGDRLRIAACRRNISATANRELAQRIASESIQLAAR